MQFLKPEDSIQGFSVAAKRLREFEGYWIIKLQTLGNYGMNGINEYQRIFAKNGLRNMFEQ